MLKGQSVFSSVGVQNSSGFVVQQVRRAWNDRSANAGGRPGAWQTLSKDTRRMKLARIALLTGLLVVPAVLISGCGDAAQKRSG